MFADSGRGVAPVVALALALVLAPAAAAPVAGQSGDTVTLTVSVVTDRETPVGGATVVASWDGGSTRATTASNGKVFVDVPAGATVSLDVRHDRYARNVPFRVTPQSDRDVTVEVRPAVTLTYTVTDPNGQAVTGASVTVVDGAERVVARGETDASGRYATDALEAGKYWVRISEPGFYNYTVTETPSQDITRQVTLERGTATLTVGVYDAHVTPPRPVANATVTVAGVGQASTADGGTASLGVPVNTRVEVTVEKAGYRPVTRQVAVGGEPTRLNVSTTRSANLTLSPANRRIVVGETVVVEVRDAYGDPAANVTVLRDGEAVGATNAQGEIEVPIEAAGEHELRARGRGVYSNRVTVEGVRAAQASATGTPTAATATDDSSDSLAPGFGALPALLAVLLAGLMVRYAASRR